MVSKKSQINYKVLDEWRAAARSNRDGFFRSKYKIVNRDGFTQDLELNSSQRLILKVIDEERKAWRSPRLNILKSRQRGISTGNTAFLFHDCYTGENASAVIMTHLESVTEDLRQKMLFAYENLPEIAKMPFSYNSMSQMGWGHNNSLVRFGSAENPNFAIGRTVRQFLGSENTRWPDFNTIYKDNLQGVPDSIYAWVILESTAKGTDHPTYDFWKECEKGNERFIPIFLKFWEDEDAIAPPFASQYEQDETLDRIFSEFAEAKERMEHFFLGQAQMSYEEAARRIFWYYQMWVSCRRDNLKTQENYPMTPDEAFIASGNPFYPMDVVSKLSLVTREGQLYDPLIRFNSIHNLVKAPTLDRAKDTYLEIFEDPEPGEEYLVAADAAMGTTKGDYSCATVHKKKTGDVVAVARGRIEIDPFSDICIGLTEVYNKCLLVPEAVGQGGSALMELLKYKKFTRLWRRKDFTARGWLPTNQLQYGWDTNNKTRPIMLEQSRRLMRERFNSGRYHTFIPSAHLLAEMRTFVDIDGKPQHKKNAHDDMVLAWNIGIIVCLIESNIGALATGLITAKHGTEKIITDSVSINQTLKMVMNENWTGQSFSEYYGGKNG